MQTDKNMQVSTAQAVTTASAVSTDSIDQKAARNLSAGRRPRAVITVTEAAVGTATLMHFQVISADDAALTSNVTVLGKTPDYAKAALTVGAQIVVDYDTKLASVGQQYLGVRYISDNTWTAGAYDAEFAEYVDDGKTFYSGGKVNSAWTTP